MVGTAPFDDPAAATETLPPSALIVSLFGLYAREAGGWLSVAAMIKLMAQLGVDETAVRSSVSRLKRRGIVHPERIDGAAGYTLGERTRHILEFGDRRIFGRRPARVADGWVLATFSVPESERNKRHLLRSRLIWLGFGSVSSGVWIAPWHLEEEAQDILSYEGLAGYVDLFRAGYVGFDDLPAKVATWWDLARLDALYAQFVRNHAGPAATWSTRRSRRDQDRDAFVDYVRCLTTWRRLPYLDPGLPTDLLPADWSGQEASALFDGIRSRLAARAHRYVDSVRSGDAR